MIVIHALAGLTIFMHLTLYYQNIDAIRSLSSRRLWQGHSTDFFPGSIL